MSVNEIVKQRAVRRLPRTAVRSTSPTSSPASALHFDDRVRQAALEPDFSTSDRAPDCAEDPQHDTDHHEDSADGVKDRDACEITDQEKDDAEDDHGQSDPMLKTLELAVRELPDPSKSKHSGRGQAHFRHGDGSVAIENTKALVDIRGHFTSPAFMAVGCRRRPGPDPSTGGRLSGRELGTSRSYRYSRLPGLNVEHQKCCGRVCFSDR